jgi:hypothetical protein
MSHNVGWTLMSTNQDPMQQPGGHQCPPYEV